MTDKEVMQMALDIMVSAIKAGDWVVDGACDPDWVLNALSAALAQPEPEPVACIVKDCENHKHQGHFVGDLCGPCHAFIARNEGKYSQAYRNAKREWQGLTDEERLECEISSNNNWRKHSLLVEAKLKEKNA
jgi:hypothetical protein